MLTLDSISVAVLSGVGFLILSLVPVSRLLQIIRSTHLRRAWICLSIMIVGFILGYLLLIPLIPRDTDDILIKLMCVILVMGGVFVMSVAILAKQTADDVARLVRLEREVIIDPLTGIYNRRFFDEQYERETLLAGRANSCLSVLVMDLDHFKAVNDDHGHAVGDRVLAVVASVVNETVRGSDILVRYGGEEFVVLAPATSGEAATQLAERICQRVRDLKVSCPGGVTVSVTLSIGIASMCPEDDKETLFARADAALYEAKRAGRNQVVMGYSDTDFDSDVQRARSA